MEDEHDEASGDPLPDEPPVEVFERGDRFLAMFVALANDTGMEISVTLFVAGTMITGLLAPAPNYFEEFGALFNSGLGFEEDSDLRRNFSEMALEYRVPSANPRQIGFLHLKNAQARVGANFVPEESTSWLRLRISSIDGWILGGLQAAQAD